MSLLHRTIESIKPLNPKCYPHVTRLKHSSASFNGEHSGRTGWNPRRVGGAASLPRWIHPFINIATGKSQLSKVYTKQLKHDSRGFLTSERDGMDTLRFDLGLSICPIEFIG